MKQTADKPRARRAPAPAEAKPRSRRAPAPAEADTAARARRAPELRLKFDELIVDNFAGGGGVHLGTTRPLAQGRAASSRQSPYFRVPRTRGGEPSARSTYSQ